MCVVACQRYDRQELLALQRNDRWEREGEKHDRESERDQQQKNRNDNCSVVRSLVRSLYQR